MEQYRFICTPHMPVYLAGGGAVGATGLVGTVNIDVYPMIVLSQKATVTWRCVASRR